MSREDRVSRIAAATDQVRRRVGVMAGVRRALGLGAPADAPPVPIRKVFFGTYQTLRWVFETAFAMLKYKLQYSRSSRRRGISAKSPFAREKGRLWHAPRLARATGPGSLGCGDEIRQLLGRDEFKRAWDIARQHDNQTAAQKKPPARLAGWVNRVAAQNGVALT